METHHNIPPTHPPYAPQIRRYQDWLQAQHGLRFDDYDALWRWSTTDLDAFWQSVWDYFDLQSPTPHSAVLAKNVMPGAQWFPGAQVNYARQVLRHVDAAQAAGQPALIGRNERGERRELSWPALRRQVAALALHMRAQGVQPGDRVAAYLPNIPETIVAFLACASIGAVWSLCAPDMGTHAVLDRFRQIAPTVLLVVDGVTYGGRDHDRCDVLAELRAQLPTLRHVVLVNNLDASKTVADTACYASVIARNDAETAAFEPAWLPFDHPLWIVYSSGTTGLPKPIVHGHGGMLLVMLQLAVLHNDIGCSYAPNSLGERYHWYSSTGWIMWNAQVGGLLGGTTCVLYDGNPGGSKERPDWTVLWRMAAEERVTFFGAGAAFYGHCMKAGITPAACGDLSAIRVLGSTGSPLPAEVQRWGSQLLASAGVPQVWWCNISGGTDFAGSFIGGNRELPQTPGRMQCRMLGAAVEAWDERGRPVLDAVGELVCTQPIPSMPLFLWGDADGARYRASYFDMYPPGHGRRPGGGDLGPEAGAVWRHGDWIEIGSSARPGCVIYGRSDATINRHGLRMGTSEIYSAVEALPEVLDSLVVDLEYLGRASYMPLFVVLRSGLVLDDGLRARINDAIRASLSPRFLPDEIVQVAEVPRTLSGKKQELPVKKLLLGQPMDKVVNPDAMANPGCLAWYVDFAARRAAGGAS
ncbi:acetoacetate--CoA ligase [Diaphorobacter sp. C33]|uniref:Acetoacetyl-CoA synthetase n=1 Tax=Diaphorobacter nitroreducens TaxID=164759 RepID=A0AAX1WWI3_9BURK|nr:acetoacetate--CoA ligase [Diaphorobacter sp. C33]ROR49057.1 acetoacetyl-CoA synthetase [Diaphorobacter nitroreducens]WKK88977.1 acetoacetate--CoA ligase [Diaphorobacter sp. C33]